MNKVVFNKKEKYYPVLMKNKIRHDNNKKIKETEIKNSSKKLKKMIYFLSDKKERNSMTFFKTFIGNTEDISNNILNKKLIKVNTDNKSKSKNNIYNSSCINNTSRRTNPKTRYKFNIKDILMNQKINKFESRIDKLLNVINDFEMKYIYSPETQKIKEEFNSIINKKIYKDKIIDNNLNNSNDKSEISNNLNILNNTDRIKRKERCRMDINNININISNNNYENNYFVTHSINETNNKKLHKKKNYSDNKLNTQTNNIIINKNIIKSNKSKSKCKSNDIKNKALHNNKEKKKIFKKTLECINIFYNNKTNIIKNNRYNNNTYRDIQMNLTERKKKDNEDNNKNIESSDFRNNLKNIIKKKNNFIRINKASSNKIEIKRRTFIKKEGSNRVNIFKNKKNSIKKKLTPTSIQDNPFTNNTMNVGLIKENLIDLYSKNKDKEKSINGSAELIKIRKKHSTDFINYILNKRNIIKNNNNILFRNNNHNNNGHKDFNYNKKIIYKKNKANILK